MNLINYLITGGAGFIGINLCKFLLKNFKNNIIIIDDQDNNLSNDLNDLIIKYPDRIIFLNINIYILNIKYFTNLLKIYNIYDLKYIFHLACNASPQKYQQTPLYILDTCYTGTKNILEVAKLFGSRIIYASTSEIYGNPKVSKQKESYFGNVNPIGERSCYDEGKRIGETLCYEYNKLNVNVGIVRIFNTYGPHMKPNDGRVISNFINQNLSNKKITIYGNGLQTRSFCFIDDLIDGLIKFIAINNFGPINLGNSNEMTILNLANKIQEITNIKSEIIFLNLPQDDPIIRNPVLDKAKELLNWEPKININDGLKKTIEYFSNLN